MKPKELNSYVWCIAYIRPDQVITKVPEELTDNQGNPLPVPDPLEPIKKQLSKKGFEGIEVYIPTLKLLKKTFKNKPEFIYVPLLFNYGFFKIPINKAISAAFLQNLRESIPAIYGWVKEPKKLIQFPVVNEGGDIDYKRINASVATDEEIYNLITKASELSIHSQEDLAEINAGDTIMLRGYPFEGLYATIDTVDKKKSKLEVTLALEGIFKKVTVDFQNVFYTVYASETLDTLMGHQNIDDLSISDVKY
jgi:transcription antitermination factor NusG